LKNILLKFLAIGVTIIVFLCVLDYFVTSEVTNSSALTPNKIQRYLNGTPADEIAVFGNSRATKGYMVDSIAPNAYNYGMPNENFVVIELLLSMELKKKSTAPIILDVHDYFYEHDVFLNINIETYIPFVKENEKVKKFLEINHRNKPYYSIVGLRYFGLYTVYSNIILSKLLGWDKKIYAKGGIFETGVHDKETFKKRVEKRLSERRVFKVDKEREARFTKFFEENPNRKFILVMSPYHYSLKNSLSNYDEMVSYYKDLSTTYSNVEFLFFESTNYPDSFFKDTIHLNILGSSKFSRELKEELKRRGII
jgi:hypothetical protein